MTSPPLLTIELEKTAPCSIRTVPPQNSQPVTSVPLWILRTPPLFRTAPVMIESESANAVPPFTVRLKTSEPLKSAIPASTVTA